MPPLQPSRVRLAVRLGGLAAMMTAIAGGSPPCLAIEMFTYFGDGSRIGLPSLEVPVEAYRGIPLRSDRLRARRAAQRAPGSTAQAGRPGVPGGMTVRTMPGGAGPAAPAARPLPQAARAMPPGARLAPEPEQLFPSRAVDGGVSGHTPH